MSLRIGILVAAVAMAIAGSILIVNSSRIPEWTDLKRAESYVLPPANLSPEAQQEFNQSWYQRRDALRTNKWPLFDFGSGLIALAATLVAVTLALRIRAVENLRALRTPPHRWLILLLCIFTWVGFIYASGYFLAQEETRGMFLPWADSIAIPVAGLTLLLLAGLIVMVPLVWLSALRGAVLPVNMWVWRPDALIASWFFTICAGISMCVAAYSLGVAFAYGPYVMIPVSLLWAYCTLAVRAAALSKSWGMRAPEGKSPESIANHRDGFVR